MRRPPITRYSCTTTRRNGVTLLEVLLSMAILGAALAALSTLTSNAIQAARRCEDDTEAAIRCQSQLDRLLAATSPIQAVRWRPLEDAPSWVWSAQVTSSPFANLSALTVSVKREGDENPAFALTQWIRRSRLERSWP